MIVGGGQRGYLRYPQIIDPEEGGALELGRVADTPDPQDHPLAIHQPRHGMVGSDSPRIGDARGGACEICNREFAGSCLGHDLLIVSPELREI